MSGGGVCDGDLCAIAVSPDAPPGYPRGWWSAPVVIRSYPQAHASYPPLSPLDGGRLLATHHIAYAVSTQVIHNSQRLSTHLSTRWLLISAATGRERVCGEKPGWKRTYTHKRRVVHIFGPVIHEMRVQGIAGERGRNGRRIAVPRPITLSACFLTRYRQ